MAAVYFNDYKEKCFEILSDRFRIVKSLRQSFHYESKKFQYLSHIRSNPRHLLRLKNKGSLARSMAMRLSFDCNDYYNGVFHRRSVL